MLAVWDFFYEVVVYVCFFYGGCVAVVAVGLFWGLDYGVGCFLFLSCCAFVSFWSAGVAFLVFWFYWGCCLSGCFVEAHGWWGVWVLVSC